MESSPISRGRVKFIVDTIKKNINLTCWGNAWLLLLMVPYHHELFYMICMLSKSWGQNRNG